MALPPLNVKIGADTAGFDRAVEAVQKKLGDMRGVTNRLGGSLKQFGNSVESAGKKMLPVSAGIAAIGAAAAGIINSTANAGVEISNMARISGTTAEEFQKLAAGARTVGIENGKLADIYKDMNDRVGDFMATGGGPMADFFENIAPKVGVTADQFARLSGPEAMQLYVDSLEKAGASQQDMTFYMEALAGDASALIPLLQNNGAEMQRLGEAAAEAGGIMDSKAVAASREFQEQMLTLQDGLAGARNEIGAALLPVALELAQAFQDKVVPAIVSVAEGIGNAVEWFGALPGPVQEAAGLVAAALGVGGPILLAVGVLSKALGALVIASGPIGLFIAAAGLMTAAWMTWGDEIKAIVSGAATWMKETFQSVLDFYMSIPGKMLEIGRNIVLGLWNGLQSAWEEFSLVDTMKGWASGIGNTFKEALGIQSPSTVFHQFGMNIGEGLRNGIQSSFGMVRNAVQGLGKQTTEGAFDMAKGVVGAMGEMFKGSKPIAMAQALINTFQGITEALKLPFPASLAAAAKVAAQGFAAVRGIQSAKPGSGSSGGAASSGAASGGAAAQSQAPAPPTQTVIIDAPGMDLSNFVNMINKATKEGYNINLRQA